MVRVAWFFVLKIGLLVRLGSWAQKTAKSGLTIKTKAASIGQG